LAAILVGNDKASELYVTLKERACERAEIDFHLYKFDESQTDSEIIEVIKFLNQDPDIDAILVQLPLPEKFDEKEIIKAMDPKKDVDGFHPENILKLQARKPEILSPLALGIDAMIQETKIKLENKKITILSNSEIFAEPFKFLYAKHNQVTGTNLKDPDHKEKCHEADILIVAIGNPKYITNEFVKDQAVVIDVGINDLGDETVGDVDFHNVMLKAGYITPVPGGVGPLTIAYLLKNTIRLAENHQ